MADDPRLAVLIDKWQAARAHGTPPEPEALCGDCPELTEALRARIASVTQCQRDTDSGATTPASPAAPPTHVTGFRLVRVLGEGGMGIVYEAEDLALHRRVAIKMLRPHLVDSEYRDRFLREARSAASLRHDFIVTVHQVGQEGDTPFLVMEYLQGESLEQRLERQSWLPVPEALRIARQVAEGLAAAHGKGMVHRDVKPANIWLETPLDRVKLLDFGLARPASGDSELTAHGAVVGTPGYMAPEQIYAGPLDGRSDLYALGCVLFRMLSGQLPHAAPDTMRLLEAVVTQEAPDVRLSARHIPGPVADVLRPLLAANPSERPSGAELVADRLRDLERGTIVLPRALPTAPKTALPPRRHNIGMWAGALTIALAALVGLAVAYSRLAPRDGDKAQAAPVVPAAPSGAPIRVGVLHSLTGTFAGSERPMVNALVLATEEVNQAGGVLGRPVELVIADGRSDEHEFARLADKLLTQDKVQAIFGCWSSSSRKRVTAACARHQSLLIYACLGEGLELSDHMVNVGGAANQQMQPAVNWAFTELHCRRFFLVGSDYLYSHAAHQILRGYLDKLGATVVGEEYVPLEGTKFAPIIASIQEKKADVIFNTVDGSSNVALFQALRGAGIRPHQLPTFWLSIGEDDMSALRLADLVGDYEAGPYFQSIDAPANHAFHKRYAARYPGRPHIDDETQASYCSLHMWKLAAEKAGSAEPLRVREAFRGLTYEAPEGRMRIDEHNLYAWRMARVGRFTDKHEFEVVFTTPRPLAPQPFPDFRSRAQWEEFTQSLYQRWGGCWEAPRASAVP